MHSYSKKKTSKGRRKATQARQTLLLQSRRLGTTHIFVIVGKKFGCLGRNLPARYAALTASHPSHPLLPGMGVAPSLLPPDGAWGRGVQAGLCVGGGKGTEQAALRPPSLPSPATRVRGNESSTSLSLPERCTAQGVAVWDTPRGPPPAPHRGEPVRHRPELHG